MLALIGRVGKRRGLRRPLITLPVDEDRDQLVEGEVETIDAVRGEQLDVQPVQLLK